MCMHANIVITKKRRGIIHFHVCVRVCACVCVRDFVCLFVHSNVCVMYTHTHVRGYVHWFVLGAVFLCMHVCKSLCIRARMHVTKVFQAVCISPALCYKNAFHSRIYVWTAPKKARWLHLSIGAERHVCSPKSLTSLCDDAVSTK
jgi:hypothetical protein